MSEERRRILDMLATGKITAEETERLLDALGDTGGQAAAGDTSGGPKAKPKYLCVLVEPKIPGKDRVNIKIPLLLVKAGAKLGAMMPNGTQSKISGALKEKGIDIDLNKMDSETIDAFVEALTETSIDVDDTKEVVRIYCG